jgi:predicted dehydrogenase
MSEPTANGAAPAPRIPDSMAAPPLRWGVLGPGWIAERFVRSLQENTRQKAVAVGSRNLERAQDFASRLGLPRAFGSYDALVDDPEIDVVYVATPHTAHHACALLSLRAGKHTLVEKPLALDASQAGEIASAARRAGVFCMEALWTFFLPKFDAIGQIIEQGVLGEIRSVIADHGEHFAADHRIMRPELAGGPLLDLGTYPVALATALLGDAERVLASGQDVPSGVTGQAAIVLAHAHGNQSVIHTTIQSNTPGSAVIAGTEGTLTMPRGFYFPGDFSVTASDGKRSMSYREPEVGHAGLHFEAAEVARCIDAGRLESAKRPLSESILTLTVLDRIQAQLGTTYDDDTRARQLT